jgi:hypothetical protein
MSDQFEYAQDAHDPDQADNLSGLANDLEKEIKER